ncbi:hypothetical protein LUZ61_002122 [Rhynchospora tenuis]|uniref:Transmembrane protein n=1 Tax=Rhynchospora tenuis TaxID=198213 RepID=A0AAD5ZIA2_9POAL|nr:hypothetical protein LUZ61_002122 [Rhynchospora tenuis]
MRERERERQRNKGATACVEELRPTEMGAETTRSGGGGFRAKIDHYMYSGNPKHVFAGITIIAAVFAVPWYFMTRGAKHQSHQDYMEKAEKASQLRSERLSSGQPSLK